MSRITRSDTTLVLNDILATLERIEKILRKQSRPVEHHTGQVYTRVPAVQREELDVYRKTMDAPGPDLQREAE